MNTGTPSPRSASEVRDAQLQEMRMQAVMDTHYVARGHRIVTRAGTKQYDLVLAVGGMVEQKIEEKFRDAERADLLIELVQDVCTGDLGWFYHTGCDFLHYVFCPAWSAPSVYYRVAWQPFKTWMLRTYLHGLRFPTAQTSVAGYGLTLNIAVPLKVIPGELLTRIEVNTPGFYKAG